MAASFAVQSFPLASSGSSSAMPVMSLGFPNLGPGVNGPRIGPTMEIESKMEMAGRVRVLHFFSHHVEAKADCRVAVAISDGSVLGFHC